MNGKKNRKIGDERRKDLRLSDNIFISYRSRSRKFRAIAKNISSGGLMFESEKKMPVGTELEFEIYQPANQFKTLIFVIPVSIKIMWRQKIKYGFLEDGENEHRVGVGFIKIREEDREKIAQYIGENLKIK